MDTNVSLKKFTIDENNKFVGNIEVNTEILHSKNFIRPFIRDNIGKEIIKFGNRDYNAAEQYIITSLNDYYNRLNSATGSEKIKMLNTYRRLYGMWRELYNYKKSQNLVEIDKMYDLFSYELYILGYIN